MTDWLARLAAECRATGNAELLADLDALAYQLVETTDDAVGHALVAARLDAVRSELARRERLHAAVPTLSDPRAPRYEQWRDLARQVRERHAGILDLLDGSYGPFRRRGSDEYHGPCPHCGGSDRFIVWPGPTGRFWCRRCGCRGDVIDAYRLVRPTADFHAAVAELAADVGLPAPEAEAKRPPAAAPATDRLVLTSFGGVPIGPTAAPASESETRP